MTKLGMFREKGWCSICNRGKRSRVVVTVIRSMTRLGFVQIAFCGQCLDKMTETWRKK